MDFSYNRDLSPEEVIQYVREKYDLFPKDAELTAKEIGDGNLNYVYRIEDGKSGKSVIVKHATEAIRMNQSKFSTDRSRIEAELLKVEGGYAPGFVPEVYAYDPVMCCTVMEDLRDYENLRYGLMAHTVYPTLAEDISTFMARTLICSTDVVLDPVEKKKQVAHFLNPSLCALTENAVYANAYKANEDHNFKGAPDQAYLEREFYEDKAFQLEITKCLQQFKCKAQSLIHGDLHSGSIFVRQGKTMVLDPEFGYYGPAGYDVGNVIAHLIFAWVNATFTIQDADQRQAYRQWLEQTIADTIDLFREKSIAIIRTSATKPLERVEGFAEWYVDDILADTAGVAGAELMRRMPRFRGKVHLKDLAVIPEDKMALADRLIVTAAKQFVFERNERFKAGQDYITVLHEKESELVGK